MKIFIVNENIQGKFSVTISYRDFRKYFLYPQKSFRRLDENMKYLTKVLKQ